jgi:hypothetical protein
MLKDRRVLLEKEVLELTKSCGKMYLKIITDNAESIDYKIYESMKEKLTDMTTDLLVVNQLIADGNK